MEMKFRYEKKEVEALVLEAHAKKFGEPPAGERWVCSESYSRIDVTNELIPEPVKAPEPEEETPPIFPEEDPDFEILEDLKDVS